VPRAEIDGLSLYYEEEGQGTPLIFAHGGDGNHLCWWRQVSAFRDRFRCIAYDAEGFGLSERKSPPAGMPMPSAHLLGLMDHLGIDRAVLIGHSMGGMAVSGVAQTHPDRVRALVMSDTPFGFQTASLSRWAELMIEKISSGFDVLEHLFAPGFAEREPELHYLYRGICRMKPGTAAPRATGDAALEPYRRWRDAAPVDYSQFPVPSLFIVGDQDELTLPWLMEGTAGAVGGSKSVVIAGAGHSPFVEQTEVYNRALLGFLDSL
jgi:pimeloyl-ACP methyl ester carboxylesterase